MPIGLEQKPPKPENTDFKISWGDVALLLFAAIVIGTTAAFLVFHFR